MWFAKDISNEPWWVDNLSGNKNSIPMKDKFFSKIRVPKVLKKHPRGSAKEAKSIQHKKIYMKNEVWLDWKGSEK